MKYHVPTVEAIISHWSVFFPPMYIGCAPIRLIGPIGLIGIAGIVGFWCGEGDLGWFLGAVVAGLWFLEFFGVVLVILLVKNFAISGKVATFVTANEGYAS